MEFTFGNVAVAITAITALITGVWAVRKVTAESESVVVTTAEKVVILVRKELESSEKKRKEDLEKYEADRQAWAQEREALRVEQYEQGRRIQKLELALINLGVDPEDINRGLNGR